MRTLTSAAIACIVVACGCSRNSQEAEGEGAKWLSVGDPVPEPFYVNPAFPGGSSILEAARRAFPDSDFIVLYSFWLGSDAQYEYALFFVEREIKKGWEASYFRDLVFAKRREDVDWSRARVFDCPDVRRAPFNGPIEFLEKNGEEFRGRPIQSVQTGTTVRQMTSGLAN